jgi:hypothetical protein
VEEAAGEWRVRVELPVKEGRVRPGARLGGGDGKAGRNARNTKNPRNGGQRPGAVLGAGRNG